jgi:hypothetical protein
LTLRQNNSTEDNDGLFFERNLGSSNALNIPKFNNGIPRKFRASVEQADLDGDGDADLILAWADGEVGAFRNIGKREDKKVRGRSEEEERGGARRSEEERGGARRSEEEVL